MILQLEQDPKNVGKVVGPNSISTLKTQGKSYDSQLEFAVPLLPGESRFFEIISMTMIRIVDTRSLVPRFTQSMIELFVARSGMSSSAAGNACMLIIEIQNPLRKVKGESIQTHKAFPIEKSIRKKGTISACPVRD